MTGEPTGADHDGSVDVATGSTEHNPLPPNEMSDEELHSAYQSAKQNGTTLRIDELQLEIAQRWEDQVERADDTEFTIDGRFGMEGFSLTAYQGDSMAVVEEAWFTWDEVADRHTTDQSDFTFQL